MNNEKENEKEKVLFEISREKEGIRVTYDVTNEKDLFTVAVSMAQLFKQTTHLHMLVESVMDFMENDARFADEIEKHTIEIPDFNNILKN